jgi:anaerobic dimethyl sulfoxide reductase subunit B (iron-sulfur subunit)
MAQLGIYFDQSRCTGCYTCVISCKDWYDPGPTEGAGTVSRMRVKSIERGTFPDLYAAYLALACCQCENPPCIRACPADAIRKREEDGIVVVDQAACLGREVCPEKCRRACPWDAPQFGPERGSKMEKCEFCVERLEEGRRPVCVEACPMFALDIGPLEELRRKYGDAVRAEGFPYRKQFGPAVVFKPRKRRVGKG